MYRSASTTALRRIDDDRMRRARRRVGGTRVELAGLAQLDDLPLEDLDRHAAGAFTAEVSAHAVRHRVQRDVVVAQEAVLVVVALATDVGRAPADDAHSVLVILRPTAAAWWPEVWRQAARRPEVWRQAGSGGGWRQAG